jgi:chromosome segregation ATPase
MDHFKILQETERQKRKTAIKELEAILQRRCENIEELQNNLRVIREDRKHLEVALLAQVEELEATLHHQRESINELHKNIQETKDYSNKLQETERQKRNTTIRELEATVQRRCEDIEEHKRKMKDLQIRAARRRNVEAILRGHIEELRITNKELQKQLKGAHEERIQVEAAHRAQIEELSGTIKELEKNVSKEDSDNKGVVSALRENMNLLAVSVTVAVGAVAAGWWFLS